MKVKRPELPPETKDFYYSLKPIYDHFRMVKVKDYCDCCGHYTGFHEVEKGVKLLRYEVVKKKKDMHYFMMKKMMPHIVENVLDTPTMLTRILNMSKKEKV